MKFALIFIVFLISSCSYSTMYFDTKQQAYASFDEGKDVVVKQVTSSSSKQYERWQAKLKLPKSMR